MSVVMSDDLAPHEDLATGCVCRRCTPDCKHRPLRSCCGACMSGSPFDDPTVSPKEEWERLLAKAANRDKT